MFFAVNGESRRSSDAEITRHRITALREGQRPLGRQNLMCKAMSLPLPKKGNKKPFTDFLFMVEPVRAHRGASIAPTDGLWK
jgi:hypothetical protein